MLASVSPIRPVALATAHEANRSDVYRKPVRMPAGSVRQSDTIALPSQRTTTHNCATARPQHFAVRGYPCRTQVGDPATPVQHSEVLLPHSRRCAIEFGSAELAGSMLWLLPAGGCLHVEPGHDPRAPGRNATAAKANLNPPLHGSKPVPTTSQ